MSVALITGTSRGIGRATALLLATQGYCVVLNYRQNQQAALEVVQAIQAKGGKALAMQVDVSQEVEVLALFEQLDKLDKQPDALVNNAGIFFH